MAYIDQQDPRRRAVALAGTAAVHAALGVAIVTGLTIAGYKPIDERKPIVEFPAEELPEPTPTPTPTQTRDVETPLPPLPVPPIPFPPQPGPKTDPADDQRPLPNPFPNPGPTAQPDPPRPTPAFTPRAARPSNDKARWITNDDYPARALRDEVEGTVGYRLVVGSNGRVAACEITRSSGNSLLDETSCRLIERRARFEAATDGTGANVLGSYTGTVRWEIPD